MTFPSPERDIPFISTQQMREVDRAMIEDYGIVLMQMMENAGRCLATVARERFLGGDAREHHIEILVGKGGNGGGGLVAARRLQSWGSTVLVRLSSPAAEFSGVPERQLASLTGTGVTVEEGPPPSGVSGLALIIDAIIGYSLRGSPSGTASMLIRAANVSPAPVLSLDVPSGVDTAAGTVHDPSIDATATMTLALPKEGLRASAARQKVGELYLADIGVPSGLYETPSLGLSVGPIFAKSDILRLW